MNHAIRLQMDGFGIHDYIIESDDPRTILREMETYQDLNCLYRMGSAMERTKKGREGIERLGKFLDRVYDSGFKAEDFKLIDMDLSCGSFHITETADSEEEVEVLKKSHPELKVVSCG